MKANVSFYNQGCRLNLSETASMTQQFLQAGYAVNDLSEASEIVVVNTCTVTENGDADTRRLLRKIARLNAQAKVALVGCQAQILKDKLLVHENVKWVVGNAQKMDLVSILGEDPLADSEPVLIAPKMDKGLFTVAEDSIDTKHVRANLKIQDGCDFYCAFCVIPFARGPARSREFDDILREAGNLVAAGHKELVLTGVNIGTYEDGEKRFLDIIDALDRIDGLVRVRISSIEPTTVPEALFDRMADPKSKLCPYLHLPLQSGSDTVLSLMKRKYTVADYDAFIQEAVKRVPDICIGTDVIVGFPGETDALFNETHAYLKTAPIHYFHVFTYSERQMARSRRMAGQVEASLKADRSAVLRALSLDKRKAFYEQFLGKDVTILVEQHKRGMWSGLSDNFLRICFKDDAPLRNTFQTIRLDGVLGESALIGQRRF